ncbi:MAG: GNAT family N-acetyltransferase [Bacteroidales bacterium]|jgi:hypothetical protein|nr:GNAT family N-acetyltransferase [Bacteroidales bacterium]
MEYEIKQLKFDDGEVSLNQLVNLQNIVYEGKKIFNIEGFKRWYVDNPMGIVISFNAFYNDELVAHYACIPIKMMIEDRLVLGLLDMATVTHPNHRGKGLFKKLAKITYDYSKENGFEFVIGVANANSFPGYMKYFPYEFISKLDVKIGIGNTIKYNKNKLFSTYWDKESLEWRLSIRNNQYYISNNNIYGRFKTIVKTFMGCFEENLISNLNVDRRKSDFCLKLYVGLGADIKGLYFKVPKFIKRSPFNLIFLDLTEGRLPKVNKDNIFYQLIDFDVA